MQKHSHIDSSKLRKIQILIVLGILSFATIAVLYLRALGDIQDYSSGEGRIKSSKQIQRNLNTQKTTEESISGEMN